MRRSTAFKQDVLERMSHREMNVKAMAKELGVPRSTVYQWKLQAEQGRRRKAAAAEDPQAQAVRELKAKVAELEGAIGRKTLESGFFRGCLAKNRGVAPEERQLWRDSIYAEIRSWMQSQGATERRTAVRTGRA